MENALATFTNTEDGLKARIAKFYKGGFSVALIDTDTDAGLAVPAAKVFANYDAAVAYAKSLVA